MWVTISLPEWTFANSAQPLTRSQRTCSGQEFNYPNNRMHTIAPLGLHAHARPFLATRFLAPACRRTPLAERFNPAG
jgi:hypothetical protein